ncbi:helix-turn-helix transcriptional regulator [Salinispora cortesiana]|uniref:helix-turn-helix transcriptional regulator n=1 Tax=Salinispora cortesiana TaxID=1305843 RepID=UPI0004700DE7|nr:LuxR C-terminal-related transcriptional regulator [Salinispora cortesiana]
MPPVRLHAHPLRKVRGWEEHLAQISTDLRRVVADRRCRVLIVQAAPGGGKTRLLAEVADIADDMGFTTVGDVMAGPPDAAPEMLQPPAVAQLKVAGSGTDRGHSPRVTFPVEATGTRLRHVAKGVPTVVTLDDLHLADLSTLTALCDQILALRGRPILWLLTFTSLASFAPSEQAFLCLSRLRGRVAVELIRGLSPLSTTALEQLIADHSGSVPDATLLALVESINDTPSAVIELIRGLKEDGVIGAVDGTLGLTPGASGGSRDINAIHLPAPVPKRLSAMIEESVQRLSEPTVKSLRLAAVLGSPFAPEELSAMLDESPAVLLTVVHEAVEHRMLVCCGQQLAFRTDSIWRVLLDSVPPPVRALLHRQAAEVLLRRPDGAERAALQLAHVAQPGNARDIEIIVEGARGLIVTDPMTAASLAMRGMELLDPGQDQRVRLANTATKALTRSGRLDEAVSLARDEIDVALSMAPASVPPARNIAALQTSMSTALLLRGDAPAARQATDDVLARQAGGPPRAEAVITHLTASYLIGDGTAVEQARLLLSRPSRRDLAVRVSAMTVRAMDQWRDGHVEAAVAILREAVGLNYVGDTVQVLDPCWFLAFALIRIDEYDEAEEVVRGLARTAASTADTPATTVQAALRVPLHLAQGQLDEAEKVARAALRQDGAHMPIFAPQALLVLAHVALRRGNPALAATHLKPLEGEGPQRSSSPWQAECLLLQAQLAEVNDGPAAALEVLAETGAQPITPREIVLEDPAVAAWWVRCALTADQPQIAGAVVDTIEHLSRLNPDTPALLAAATHARALAEADTDGLAEAGRLHRNPWAQVATAEDRARIFLFQENHESAVVELDRAMNAYARFGAEREAARVRAQLRGLGVCRRHWKHAKRPESGWESLTETERKVAELVAGGLTNQQAADRLFISPHTVGFHLRQIYRKLGIRSRAALIRTDASRISQARSIIA